MSKEHKKKGTGESKKDGGEIVLRKLERMMTMVPPTNGYARDLEQGKAGSVVLYRGTNHAGTGKIRSSIPAYPASSLVILSLFLLHAFLCFNLSDFLLFYSPFPSQLFPPP